MSEPLPRADDLSATWKFVEPGLELILGSDVSPKMYMSVYTAIYNYCINKSRATQQQDAEVQRLNGNNNMNTQGSLLIGGQIYSKLNNYLAQYVQSLTKRPDESFLQFYVRTWQRYTIGAGYLNNIFDYMNRYWVQKERSDGKRHIYDVNTLCLLKWREDMFRKNVDTLINEILEQIQLQRLNKVDSSNDLSIAIKSFVSLGFDSNDLKKTNLSVYMNDFEKKFLELTREFYLNESNVFLQNNNVVDYMRKAEARLAEENSRANLILDEHTKKPLADVLNEVLIDKHAEAMYAAFPTLLDQNQLEDIHRMYSLLQRVPPTLEPLLQQFEEYIKREGLKAIEELKEEASKISSSSSSNGAKKAGAIDPKLYVRTIIDVYKRFVNTVNVSFKKNGLFVKSLDNASHEFINKNAIATPTPRSQSKTPELLAKYSDTLLKRKAKDSDSTSDMSVDDLMTVFKFINDKDAFETHYRRLLARRLIFNQAATDGEEEAVIQRLKQENSLEYTSKMTKMFQDMQASQELRSAFRDRALEDGSKDIVPDFTMYVLAETMWPFSAWKYPFKLPKELLPTQEKFEQMYNEKHSGRQLKWIWNHCRGEVKANIAKQGKPPFILSMSVFQMAIILPFNDRDTYSFEELLDITDLSSEYLEASIAPLVKFKLLNQKPAAPEFINKPNTKFTVVSEYRSKKMRVKFDYPLKIESKLESSDTQREIDEDRKNFIQACIVRIMKARKMLNHSALINEVIQQAHSRFNPTVSDIKKCIDILIEKEYLNRVDGDSYEYLA
ncbi:hypothetical protein PACTADRAFT_4740 [Pachysolen tannophilus NRRL Y-2460]|uniref:Cullin family profile domain-containing protein n=1 Tax=Pachysolen tannophilus NRRL Y-2460 TaxID=669874 RepID=A0A1E4TQ44_PACTA|nr:hypothetical protein PACTADRAFT_4740 [Pachysolen tannophilus NRRL Y-2460]